MAEIQFQDASGNIISPPAGYVNSDQQVANAAGTIVNPATEDTLSALNTKVPTLTTSSGRLTTEQAGRDLTATGTITALNGTVAITAPSMASAQVQISGTWVATLQIQGLLPDGTTWTNLSAATGPAATALFTSAGFTANGAYRILTASAYSQLRVIATAFTSGTVTVNIVASDKISPVQSVQLYAANMQVESHQSDGFKASYSAAATNITPAATPLDIFTITGSATRVIRLTRMLVTGIQNTTSSVTVNVIKRSSANTGGTFTTLTNVPHDSSSPAATAVCRAYTVDPTLGTTVGTLLSFRQIFPSATDDVAQGDGQLYSSVRPAQAFILRGVAETIAVNLNGVSIAGGSLNCVFEWTEEAP